MKSLRIIAILLVLCMFSAVLLACNSEGDTTSGTTGTMGTSGTTGTTGNNNSGNNNNNNGGNDNSGNNNGGNTTPQKPNVPVINESKLVDYVDAVDTFNGKDFDVDNVELGQADYSKERLNISGWYDGEYDRLIATVYNLSNDDQSREFMADVAESYLVSAMPVCPLVFNQNFTFKSSKISKLKFDGLGNFIFTDVKLSGYKNYYKPEEKED